jgi:hypothetical protein
MQRDVVASSNIASVGYDVATETLEIEFTNSSIYQYYNVTQGLYEQFKAAPTKGVFLNTYIRNVYPFSRVG